MSLTNIELDLLLSIKVLLHTFLITPEHNGL